MRVLVIFAHPVESSFQAALHLKVVETLIRAGHKVDDLDLYAEDFDPLLSSEERSNYHNLEADRSAVRPYIDRLTAAEALVLIYPVWNYGFPAILKGFFDRVFLPGVSFEMQDGKVSPSLQNISKLVAVTTYGGTWWRAFLAGDPPRKLIMRFLRAITRPGQGCLYLAHYDMNRSTTRSRETFLDQVAKEMEQF
ncbi:MAG: NAD(P)H-dependent oxidoreductase [Stappiaceae bacterium]